MEWKVTKQVMVSALVVAFLEASGWASEPNSMAVDLGGGVNLELVWIPPGGFDMGSDGYMDNEKPLHKVLFERGFWMGKCEVTQEQWERVMGDNPAYFKGARNPVEQVSWDDAQAFIKRLNKQLKTATPKLGFKLPSEAEWEYACRAGTTTAFHFGESLNSNLANFNGKFPAGHGEKGDDRQKTVEVGSFEPNEWGLFDLYGNVWEWCEDVYHENYVGAPTDGGAWLAPAGSCRIVRGGAWITTAQCCLSSHRVWLVSGSRRNTLGLRVVGLPR